MGVMKVALVGTGKVGSLTLQYLAPNKNIDKILIVNRRKEYSEGLIMDTVSAFPNSIKRLQVADYSDVKEADLVVITAGGIMKQEQSPLETVEMNKNIVRDILERVSFKEDAVLIVIATQVDIIAQYTQKISGLKTNQVIGFGGSLDVNRLKCLLAAETGKEPDKIKCYFIGEHGKRGISIFEEEVEDKNKIDLDTKEYFPTMYKKLGSSSFFGPGKLLVELVEAVIEDKKKELCVSTLHPNYDMYLTWPCIIGRKGVEKVVDLDLTKEQQERLEKLVEQKEREG